MAMMLIRPWLTKKKTKPVARRKGVRPPALFSSPLMRPLWRWFCWVTNNETRPKHEVEFDVAFFIINSLTVALGSLGMYLHHETPWIAILVIEYTWALDTLRNNRTYIK